MSPSIRGLWRGRWVGEKKTAGPGRADAGHRPVIDAAYALDQYEALRREALEVAPWAPRGHGLGLFVARGLSAWLAALTAVAPSRPRRMLEDEPVPTPPRGVPAARAELTAVLAGMVLACAHPREAQA